MVCVCVWRGTVNCVQLGFSCFGVRFSNERALARAHNRSFLTNSLVTLSRTVIIAIIVAEVVVSAYTFWCT